MALNTRDTSKPAIERRRRARINELLSILKVLVLDDICEQPGRMNRLDKAELLEIIVSHMSSQRGPSDPYKSGAIECLLSTMSFISDDVSSDVRQGLINHVVSWMQHNTENMQYGMGQHAQPHQYLHHGGAQPVLQNDALIRHHRNSCNTMSPYLSPSVLPPRRHAPLPSSFASSSSTTSPFLQLTPNTADRSSMQRHGCDLTPLQMPLQSLRRCKRPLSDAYGNVQKRHKPL